ncbi:NAD(P)/FAD-dependent oxidoreductase [uncultured Thiohalocapsa sp.]|uniref:NAD(P)/FAD-dependent oxidoreductase n=1 Tax=uncultured Thiohalocapsa sp. TaxID=768990 RepID=UPI0025D6690D|nr:NAD(P)/FAD-dependent oxidoreductase [uncultured Thiohalocapsa sp.]
MKTTAQGAPHVGIIGGGFCGLAAAYELGRRGVRATVLEQDAEVGGLAGSFDVGGEQLEKFYHHWFTNDVHVMELVEALGAADQVLLRPTRTGMYYANRFFKLSTPLDLLRFSALPFPDRIRLGLLALRARRVGDWRGLEQRSAAAWLRDLGGERVYRVVWEPLLRGKFGAVADEVSAVWIWNKLKLRGGSRGKGGAEQLAYFRGGFAALAERLAAAIAEQGGRVQTATTVRGIDVTEGRVMAIDTTAGCTAVDAVIATPALPIIADLLAPHVDPGYLARLRRIRYLANLCVVLELDRSLSETYWLNVNDPDFPFVGVIEHTNFEPVDSYGGRRIVYLSKYLPEDNALYGMDDAAVADFTLEHLGRMFPDLRPDWVRAAHVWRARFAQPIVERGYTNLIPARDTPIRGLKLATMAQIYPEDRGTNYAIREGRAAARALAAELGAAQDALAWPRATPA